MFHPRRNIYVALHLTETVSFKLAKFITKPKPKWRISFRWGIFEFQIFKCKTAITHMWSVATRRTAVCCLSVFVTSRPNTLTGYRASHRKNLATSMTVQFLVKSAHLPFNMLYSHTIVYTQITRNQTEASSPRRSHRMVGFFGWTPECGAFRPQKHIMI